MKKIFLFAAAMLTAVTLSAETVYQWGAGNDANQIGTQTYAGTTVEGTVQNGTKTVTISCINLKNGYLVKEVSTNYVEIVAAGGDLFLENDVLIFNFCFSNKDNSKMAVVAVYDATADTLLAESGAGFNMYSETGSTEFSYKLPYDVAKLRLGRAKSGNTTTCLTAIKVVRGEEIVEKPVAPMFSTLSGTFFEPFKVGLSSPNTDDIYCSVNGGEFSKYTDSIEVSVLGKTTIAAYSKLNDLQSETVTVEYVLKEFVPRTIFNAKNTLSFAGIQADDIEILDESVATLGTVSVGGKEYPSVSYVQRPSTKPKQGGGFEDSTMCISFKSMPGVKFIYKNSADKADMLQFLDDYLVVNGKDFELHIDSTASLAPNDSIVFVVTARNATKPYFDITNFSTTSNLIAYEPEEGDDANYTDGNVDTNDNARIDDDYSGYQNLVYIVKPTKKAVKIKETKGGYRLAKIQVGAYRGDAPSEEGIEELMAAPKATKVVYNGQVVIVKGGRMFNVLGSEIQK